MCDSITNSRDKNKCLGDRWENWCVAKIDLSYYRNVNKHPEKVVGFWKLDEWRGDKNLSLVVDGERRNYYPLENKFPDLKLIAENSCYGYAKGDVVLLECKYVSEGFPKLEFLTDIKTMKACVAREKPFAFFYLIGSGKWGNDGPEHKYLVPGRLLTTINPLSDVELKRIITEHPANFFTDGYLDLSLSDLDDPAIIENWDELNEVED